MHRHTYVTNLWGYFVKVGKKAKIMMNWYLLQVDAFKQDDSKVMTLIVLPMVTIVIQILKKI